MNKKIMITTIEGAGNHYFTSSYINNKLKHLNLYNHYDSFINEYDSHDNRHITVSHPDNEHGFFNKSSLEKQDYKIYRILLEDFVPYYFGILTAIKKGLRTYTTKRDVSVNRFTFTVGLKVDNIGSYTVNSKTMRKVNDMCKELDIPFGIFAIDYMVNNEYHDMKTFKQHIVNKLIDEPKVHRFENKYKMLKDLDKVHPYIDKNKIVDINYNKLLYKDEYHDFIDNDHFIKYHNKNIDLINMMEQKFEVDLNQYVNVGYIV